MNKNEYIEKLSLDSNVVFDEKQKEAILADYERLMVIAGAGSGKTFTMSMKVKYLVDFLGVSPSKILVISLTNKAINELKENINVRLHINASIMTFHKLAYMILLNKNKCIKVLDNSYEVIKNIIISNSNSNKIERLLLKTNKFKSKKKNEVEKYETLSRYVYNAIIYIRSKNINLDYLFNKDKNINRYLKYLKNILCRYDRYMIDNESYDFENLILRAGKEKIEFKYDYVIVDEFQDISVNRYELLMHIVNSTSAKLIVVGDDFQTIFSFAGSSASLFSKFSLNANVIKLEKTYRNSNELINIASFFVEKDNNLIKKKLFSIKNLSYPIIIEKYLNNFNYSFEYVINEIISKFGENEKILVLGRYITDIKKISSSNFYISGSRIVYKKYPNCVIEFLTVHSSKGLGYSNVILINALNNEYGFPSKLKLSKYERLFSDNDILEERRLFYVAITRTKNYFYILVKIGSESIFVKEISKYENVRINYIIK